MKQLVATVLFASLVVLTDAARAQGSIALPPERVPTPASAFDGARCTKTLAGEFTGDRVADTVSLCDGSAVLTHAPALYGGTTVLADHVSDLERWPGAAGERDSVLLSSTSFGLRLARWESSANATGFVNITALSELSDHPALHVAVLDFDGDGDWELATTALNAHDVRIFGVHGAAFDESPRTFTAQGEIADIAGLHWSAESAGQELAVLSVAGLEVLADHDAGLAVHSRVSRPCTHPLLSIVPDLPTRERVAWIADGSLPDERVLVLSDIRGSEPDLSLGAFIHVVGIGALRLAPGAPSALMLSHGLNHTLGMLIADPGAAPPTSRTYSAEVGALAYIALVNDSPLESFELNGAVPAVADFDNDGDEDLWMPIVTRAEGLLLPSIASSPCDRRPVIRSALRASDVDADSATLTIGFAPPEFEPAPSVDTLEYLVWRVDAQGEALFIQQSGTLEAPGGNCDLEFTLAVDLDPEERFAERFVLQTRLRGESYVSPHGVWSISGNVFDFAQDVLHNRACANVADVYSFASFEPSGVKLAATAPSAAAENIGGVIPRPRPPAAGGTPLLP